MKSKMSKKFNNWFVKWSQIFSIPAALVGLKVVNDNNDNNDNNENNENNDNNDNNDNTSTW